ncbi:MAG TPA: DNA-processing protein DprA [Acidobacteriota bacterium]|nr:DNA-processing protein DprA [Acidobacteriota bacterium]
MTTAVTNDLVVLYALTSRVHLGPKAVLALLTYFGSPAAVWEADLNDVEAVVGLDEEGRALLTEAYEQADTLGEELEYIIAAGTTPIGMHEERYPQRLYRLGDPPSLIFVRGELPDESATAVAVVGSHQADAEGIADAVTWGKGLVERDVVVVSGLARGIDGGAHTGALAGEGQTVAVLGSGFDNIYPPEHRGLAEEIAAHGALVSEHPPSAPLTKARLVQRNRLIVALSDAVVVVRVIETTRGSMEAIRRARDLACPVYLVASDASKTSRQAVADGAIPIGRIPDFDLVLNYL